MVPATMKTSLIASRKPQEVENRPFEVPFLKGRYAVCLKKSRKYKNLRFDV